MKKEKYKDKIHDWFGLSYAQYLIVPRSIFQSMPEKWQEDFVKLLEKLDNTFEWRRDGQYVIFKGHRRRIMPYSLDEFGDYNRGRRIIEPKEAKEMIKRYEKNREHY